MFDNFRKGEYNIGAHPISKTLINGRYDLKSSFNFSVTEDLCRRLLITDDRSVKVLEGTIWKDMSQVESSTPSIVPATRQCQSHTCLTCLVVTRVWRPWHSLLPYQPHLALLALLTHTGLPSPATAPHLPAACRPTLQGAHLATSMPPT